MDRYRCGGGCRFTLLTLTGGGGGGGASSGYSLAGMIVFEGIAICVGLLLVFSHVIERIRARPGCC